MLSTRILRSMVEPIFRRGGIGPSDALPREVAANLHAGLVRNASAIRVKLANELKVRREALESAMNSYQGSGSADINLRLEQWSQGQVSLEDVKKYARQFFDIQILTTMIAETRIFPADLSCWRGINNTRLEVDVALESISKKLLRESVEGPIRAKFREFLIPTVDVMALSRSLGAYMRPFRQNDFYEDEEITEPEELARVRVLVRKRIDPHLRNVADFDRLLAFYRQHVDILQRPADRSTLPQAQLQALSVPGQTIRFPTFLSTSLDRKMAEGFAVGSNPAKSKTGEVEGYLLEFILPVGDAVLPLTYGSELEILLSPCRTFVVMQIRDLPIAGRRIRYIRLRPTQGVPYPPNNRERLRNAATLTDSMGIKVKLDDLQTAAFLKQMIPCHLRISADSPYDVGSFTRPVPAPTAVPYTPQSWDQVVAESYFPLVLPSTKERLLSAYQTAISKANLSVTLPPVMSMYQNYESKSPQLPGNGFRLVTFNVLNGFEPLREGKDEPSRFDSMWRMLQSLQPDIVGLQEVAYHIVDERAWAVALTNMGYKSTSRCRASDLYGGYYNVLLSRTGLMNESTPSTKSSTDIALDSADYAGETRCASYGSWKFGLGLGLGTTRTLHVFNLQLDVWDNSGATRRKEITNLLRMIQSNPGILATDPVIIMGDFNCIQTRDYAPAHTQWIGKQAASRGVPEDVETVEVVRAAGFRDVAEIMGTRIPLTVWSGKRVDFLFAKNIVVRDIARVFVVPTVLSDHLMLGVDLVFL